MCIQIIFVFVFIVQNNSSLSSKLQEFIWKIDKNVYLYLL